MTDRILRIATRKSQLALWQAGHVRDRLLAAHPGLRVELLPLSTPVSYTHLDVYKRQPLVGAGYRDCRLGSPCCASRAMAGVCRAGLRRQGTRATNTG